ncbi:MAG TPA: SBBP repeat-containing protein, partial [Blastocatellia bacterium]|nr:SBBP repeat-containing protein [Blastocatellia bacterium]
GGPNYDRAYALEVDSLGFVYIAGRAGSGFPTTSGVVQPQFGGDVTQNQAYGQQDGFVAKLSPDGSRLIWSTFFGSDGRDFIRDIDVDSSGNVYLGVSDVTRPHPHIRPGAFQTTLRGTEDGVVAKLSSDARSVVWASYFGGSGDDGGAPSVRVDSSGNLFYLTNTNSSNAPTTANAYRRTYSGGWDVLLARISSDGTWLVYSTYLGGSALEFTETHGLDIDSSGNAYAAFSTKSANIPTTSTAFQRTYGGSGGSGTGNNTNYPGDAFVAKISPDGTQLLAGTYLGGRYGEGAEGVAVDSAGNVCISGATYSDNFPLSSGALQVGLRGAADQFVVKLSSNLSQLLYSSYLGGSRTDHGRTATIDTNGNLYVAGVTDSTNFPLNNPPQSFYGGGVDATLTRVSLAGCQPLLSQSSESFSATGGVGSVSVTAETSCSWTVTDNASWITITSSSSGSGSATISFSVAPNSGAARTGIISVAGLSFTVNQAAATTCSYAISPTSQSLTSSGGTYSIQVTAPTGCSWTTSCTASWISLVTTNSLTSAGAVTYSVAPNTGTSSRTGTITIGGQTHTVSQAGTSTTCAYSLSPTSQTFPSAGGSGSFTVTTGIGCGWTATTGAHWIKIVSGVSGSGSGTVSFTVFGKNNTTLRKGRIMVGGRAFTVIQQ